MATATAIVIQVPPELLGPGSAYEIGKVELKQKYDSAIQAARVLHDIPDADAAERANDLGRILQTGVKDAEAFFRPVKEQIDALKKPVLAAENEFVGRLKSEKLWLGGLLTNYNERVRREREEQERLAREEQERLQREEQLQRAIELDESGQSEQAEAVLDEPVYLAPVVIAAPAPPKVQGQVAKVSYSAKVVDVKALIKAVADGRAPLAAIKVDDSYINGIARLDKENFSLPGCELVRTNSTHFRS